MLSLIHTMVAAVAIAVTADSAAAQASPTPTPTTRILAIGTITPGADNKLVQRTLPREARETVELYLQGKIDQWYSLQDRPGVAFILSVTDIEKARAMLDQLPLGQAHLMSFELIPIGPLSPLRKLDGAIADSPRH